MHAMHSDFGVNICSQGLERDESKSKGAVQSGRSDSIQW
jgi:hypothetical protein